MIKKIVFLLPILLYAIVPSDDEYYVHKGEQATIIYTEEYAYEAQIAAAKWQRLQKIYENEFRYKPNAVFLTLSSKKNQIANAVTFSVPLLGMEFYSAGAQMINYFGYKDWIEILLAHEGAHIYQLDNKGDIPQLAQTALGRNTAPIFVGILPIFTLPNIFLPDLLLEGNAVYNESRITAAGRLYQSRHKALFMTLLKADLLTDDRILNNHILFPHMEEKYIVGGFFFEWLDRRFGNGRTNSFFALHGDRWINPFLVDLSFKEHFGEGFYTLFDAFLDDYRKEAKQLKEQEGEIISISAVAPSLGGDERRLFIYESDAKTYGDIIVLDRASLASVTEKGSFLAGKPFYINGQFATASHGYTDTALIETSLFDSDRKSLEGYNDMVIIDRHKDKILYFKTSESFAKPALYENSTRLNPSALDARYGNDGSIYTIRAEGALRAIYKNEQKLVVTDTQIAFADILPNGDIAIIAPTDRGSGLFLARNDNIYRLGEADNIIDARRIKDDLFLLVTIATRGFETKIAKLEINNDRPVRPRYNFESRDRFDLNITEPINLESKPYNALAMLRYASAYPALYTSDGYYQGSINMQFTDPLSFNTLALGFTKTDDSYAQAAYTNTRYRFYYGASGYVQLNHKTEENERNFAAEISGGYLIFNDNTSELNALLRKQYDPDDKYNAPMIASIVYSNLLKYPRSPLIDRGLSLALHTRFNDRGGENSGAVQLEYSKRLFWQFYASARAKYAASNAHTILQKEKTELLADPVNLNFYQPVDDLAAKEAFHYGWAAQIAIDAPVYFSAFPLSLHRLIPSLSYDRTTFGDLAITEKAAALEAQLLVAHKFDIALRLGVSHNSLSDKREAFFLLKTAL